MHSYRSSQEKRFETGQRVEQQCRSWSTPIYGALRPKPINPREPLSLNCAIAIFLVSDLFGEMAAIFQVCEQCEVDIQ